MLLLPGISGAGRVASALIAAALFALSLAAEACGGWRPPSGAAAEDVSGYCRSSRVRVGRQLARGPALHGVEFDHVDRSGNAVEPSLRRD